jgi:predicted TIM-barrel fold metal-dependent hydrolase
MTPGTFPIADAHQHFWDTRANYHPWLSDPVVPTHRYGDTTPLRRPYFPTDYFADAAGFEVAGTVYVETEWDPRDPLGETAWVERLRRETGFPTVMVAQAWLDRDDLDAVLEGQAAFAFVRGVRHKPPPGAMAGARWRAGYARLAGHGLRFDLQADWTELADAAALCHAFPDTPLILNHTGLHAELAAQSHGEEIDERLLAAVRVEHDQLAHAGARDAAADVGPGVEQRGVADRERAREARVLGAQAHVLGRQNEQARVAR